MRFNYSRNLVAATFSFVLVVLGSIGTTNVAVAADSKKTAVETAADNASGKIAIFNLKRALVMCNAGRERFKDLESQKDFAEDNKKLEAMDQELKRKQAEYEKEKSTWTAEQLASHQKDFDYDRQNAQMLAQKLNEKREGLLQKMMMDMNETIAKAVEKVTGEQRIGILLRPEAVWNADPQTDITDAVIAELNKSTK